MTDETPSSWAHRAPWALVDSTTPRDKPLLLVGLSRRPWIGVVPSPSVKKVYEAAAIGRMALSLSEEPIAWLPLPQLRMETP